MLHILLLILKVIGILLLIILSVILVLLLCILFVPVRYVFHAEYEEKLCVRLRVSWLLHILHFSASYQEELRWKIRIFGVPVLPGRNKEAEKKTAGKKELSGKETQKADEGNDHEEAVSEAEVDTDEENIQHVKAQESSAQQDTDTRNTDVQEKLAEQTPEASGADNNTKSEETKHNSRLFQKLCLLWKRITSFLKQISEIPHKIRYTIRMICDKISEIKENLDYYLELFSSDEFHQALILLGKQGGGLWKHIRPTKLQADITFGMEDPAATGQVLAIVSMFYPVYGNHLSLKPEFDRSCLQGHIDFKGRIRAFTVLHILAILYFDKNLKQVLKQLKKEN